MVVTQVYCQIGSLFSCILLMGTLFSVYVFMKVAQEEDKRKALGRLKKESESRSVVSDSLRPHRLHSPWNSPSQNTGVGSIPLLQGIFPTQGSNPGLPHCTKAGLQPRPAWLQGRSQCPGPCSCWSDTSLSVIHSSSMK